LIHYKLKDMKDIQPWGSGDERMLHWFALTDSYYWFDFGGVPFPKYSNEILEEWDQANSSRYVDYHFARLFWDICDVIGYVQNPVSDEIFEKVNTLEKMEKYLKALEAWPELYWDGTDEQYDEVYDAARDWIYCRRLDFGYLTGAPDLYFIRNKEQLYIYWFAKSKSDQGTSIWDTPNGTFICNYSWFLNELVKSFRAFGLDMRRKIDLLFENKPEGVIIDADQIVLNHSQYEELVIAIESQKIPYAEAPDWNMILEKVNEISRTR
jgi:hypothetical protein